MIKLSHKLSAFKIYILLQFLGLIGFISKRFLYFHPETVSHVDNYSFGGSFNFIRPLRQTSSTKTE